jgi:hypothetical protein
MFADGARLKIRGGKVRITVRKLNKRPRFVADGSVARLSMTCSNLQTSASYRCRSPPALSRIEHGYASKLELATLLQVLTSANMIHLLKPSRFSNAIRDEARRFELKITEAGSLTFGAERTSKDDLIMALTTSYGTERDEAVVIDRLCSGFSVILQREAPDGKF